MTRFQPLTPEEVRSAEQKAIKELTAKEKTKLHSEGVAKVKDRQSKKYESLTPPWVISWLSRVLPPFRSSPPVKSGPNRFVEYKETEGEKKKSRVLGRFRSMFPFMLFPDELIVEEKRVVWKNWLGPGYSRVISIMATDISNVQASHGPIFGHLHVGSLVGGPEILIEKLSRRDVVRARALIEGIILAARERVAIRKEEVEREKEELSQLGEVKF